MEERRKREVTPIQSISPIINLPTKWTQSFFHEYGEAIKQYKS